MFAIWVKFLRKSRLRCWARLKIFLPFTFSFFKRESKNSKTHRSKDGGTSNTYLPHYGRKMANLDSIPSPYFTVQTSPETKLNKTFWLFIFLICFDFLISQLRQITDHRRAGESYAYVYALRRVIVSCFPLWAVESQKENFRNQKKWK